MAKAKTFNISNFMEDAAESVHVAEQQRRREAIERNNQNVAAATTMYTPAAISEPAATYQQPQMVNPGNSTSNMGGVVTAPISAPITNQVAPPVEESKGKRGRKKSLRTIERVNGKIIFLEKSMDVDLARLSTFERFDKQDIIRTALYQWLNSHFDGMMLDNDGRRQVIEYIQKTTTFEEV